jgi:hypothetical protein
MPNLTPPRTRGALRLVAAACALTAAGGAVLASSHREAPFITTAPKAVSYTHLRAHETM